MASPVGAYLAGPATRAFAITPNDGADLPSQTRFLYVGGAGAISVIAVDDADPVVLAAVPVGTVLPIRAKRVRATGTTATNLVGLA